MTQSALERPFLPRLAGHAVELACRTAPVVALLGARQAGKSTLLRSLPALADRPYLTLDDFDLRTQAASDPESVVARAPRLVLDEVQRAADLLIAVKRAVDDDPQRTPGRFVLTGSANLLMLARIGDTLAGRALYVTLWPFTRRERLGLGSAGPWSELLAAPFDDWRDLLEAHAGPEEDWREVARVGGFPVPAHELSDAEARSLWFAGYAQTYLERDVPSLKAVQDLAGVRRLMSAASLRIGSVLNQTELGRDVGLSQPQVNRFLELMEASYQVVRLPAFSVNRTSRLMKRPKLYWSDAGLALHLSGEPGPRGAHLENLVLTDLLAWRDTRPTRPEILFWRTTTGLEIDFLVETPGRLLPIEIKSGQRVVAADARALCAFLEEHADRTDGALLLHGGAEAFPLAKGVLAVPWWWVI